MGSFKVKELASNTDFILHSKHLLNDIEAFEQILEQNLFEELPIRIGAEQEFCLVDNNWEPAHNAVSILEELKDIHFTNEIATYNLEINLDPEELKNNCFSIVHNKLDALINKASKVAAKQNTKILLTGILPTIKPKHTELNYMTPLQRYHALNNAVVESRKHQIEFHIKGVDELNLLHNSILLEGCNTSFQLHLQIPATDFVKSYNWAQAISGPVLAICTNSPLLFGKELWSETRIALFTQSVDTRANTYALNEKEARVSFGSDWAKGTAADIFKENVVRFRSLLTSKFDTNSVEQLKKGIIPKLKALSLHNGTIYRWNRPCYGVANNKPHLRIENRYIPSGPSTSDEIANFMFWVGIMVGRPKEYDKIDKEMHFKDAKSNFFNAARYGMATRFYWDKTLISSYDLILNKLLPMAYKGLYIMKVNPKDVEHYLTIIENRVKNHTGSRWMINSYRNLQNTYKKEIALQAITKSIYENQEKGYTVNTWPILRTAANPRTTQNLQVLHCMNTSTITVQEKDSLAIAHAIMRWKNIHHLPVLNSKGNLAGLITWSDITNYLNKGNKLQVNTSKIMVTNLITVTRYESLRNASKLMKDNNINCLPVVNRDKLVGILTTNDL